MKIKKVIIDNIASISHAEIDFTAAPLCDSDVFLITGNTGVGKTTILDAICLALYDTTPRLKNATNSTDKVQDGDEITIRDSRRLMRRNTDNCSVVLTITDSNEVDYQITWSVARNRNKKLNIRAWELLNLRTKGSLNKVKEVEVEIKKIVGIDYNQFCRTVMLAQGEFARFLSSSDDEKSSILERITGVDIYTRIGKKVFDIANWKNKEFESAKMALEGVEVMPPDERSRAEQEQQRLQNLEKEKAASKKIVESKLEWLKKEVEIGDALVNAENELSDARKKQDSDDYKRQKALVKDWKRTSEVREARKQCLEAANKKELLEAELKELEIQYGKLAAGLVFRCNELQAMNEKCASLETCIGNEAPRKQVLEQQQSIVAQLNQVLDARKTIKKKNDEKNKLQQQFDGRLKQDADAAAIAQTEADKSLTTQKNELSNKQKKLENTGVPALRQQNSTLQGRATDLKVAQGQLKTCRAVKEQQDTLIKNQENLKKQIDDTKDAAENMDAPILAATVLRDERKKAMERLADSVDKWAKKIRSSLQIDDVCPVCQQRIHQQLPQEEEIGRLFDEAKLLFDEAENEVKRLTDKKNLLLAEHKAKQDSYIVNAKTLEDNEPKVREEWDNALNACKKIGIETVDDTTESKLVALADNLQNEMLQLQKELDEAEKMENAVKACQNAVNQLQTALDNAKVKADNAKGERDKCGSQIEICKTLIEQKERDVSGWLTHVEQLVGDTAWQHDFRSDTENFIIELQQAATDYNGAVKDKKELDGMIDNYRIGIKSVEDMIDSVLEIMPEWRNIALPQPQSVSHLGKVTSDWKAAVFAKKEALATCINTHEVKAQVVESFLKDNATISEARLLELAACMPDDIDGTENDLKAIDTYLAAKTELYKKAQDAKTSHLQLRPALADDDNVDKLHLCQSQLEEAIKEINNQEGVLKERLDKDKENNERRASLLQTMKDKEAVKVQWDSLNNLIGSADGKKFRKIAQSYVLANLIKSANNYMGMLTDRYTMCVDPGTYIIMVEDSYQGYTKRPVSTVSGGEGFLVSLALALAMSDLGDSFSSNILFIDEGFGTLSGVPLQNAVNTLRTLHNRVGRHVGIISHITELCEKIPVQIKIRQNPRDSSSTVSIIP